MTGEGLTPAEHQLQMRSSGFSMSAVGVSRASDATAVAQAMVADGIELIELCGGFGPLGTATVLQAVGHRVPIGSVSYGPESLAALHALLRPD